MAPSTVPDSDRAPSSHVPAVGRKPIRRILGRDSVHVLLGLPRGRCGNRRCPGRRRCPDPPLTSALRPVLAMRSTTRAYLSLCAAQPAVPARRTSHRPGRMAAGRRPQLPRSAWRCRCGCASRCGAPTGPRTYVWSGQDVRLCATAASGRTLGSRMVCICTCAPLRLSVRWR